MPHRLVAGRDSPEAPGGLRRLAGIFLLLLGLVMHAAPEAYAQATTNRVYVVSIRGEIDLGLAPYLARVLEQAARENARAVILEIDTPGGRLDAVLQMRDAILASPVRTIAFVNRDALSAGALVAITANDIRMAPGASMGAATPVTGAGETASEKVISAVRSTFRSTAEARGRDPRIAEAMVDPSVRIDGLVDEGRLLTLTTTEALAWGYADGVAASLPELLGAVGLADATVQQTSPTLAENVARFLTSPVIASLLIAAGLLLVVGDLLAGGVGLASAAGVSLLAVFFWGHMLAGLAGWEGVALVVAGLILLALEVFVIPGFGVAGILGVATLAAGLFLSLIGGEIVTNDDLVRAGVTVGSGLLLTLVLAIVLVPMLARTAQYQGLVLRTRLAASGGRRSDHQSSGALAEVPAPHPGPSEIAGAGGVRNGRASLAGARGVAVSDLRPGGIARIDGDRIDVVTQGDYVSAGEPIEVVSDEGYRRVVRPLGPRDGGGRIDARDAQGGLEEGSG